VGAVRGSALDVLATQTAHFPPCPATIATLQATIHMVTGRESLPSEMHAASAGSFRGQSLDVPTTEMGGPGMQQVCSVKVIHHSS
jgi:hypothetical protein